MQAAELGLACPVQLGGRSVPSAPTSPPARTGAASLMRPLPASGGLPRKLNLLAHHALLAAALARAKTVAADHVEAALPEVG